MIPTSTPIAHSSAIQQTLKKAIVKPKKPRWRRGTGVENLIVNCPEIAEWYRNGLSLNAIRIRLKAEKKLRCCRTTIQKALVELGCADELAKRRTKQS